MLKRKQEHILSVDVSLFFPAACRLSNTQSAVAPFGTVSSTAWVRVSEGAIKKA